MIITRPPCDCSKKTVFFLDLQKSNASRTLFLASKLGQAVDIAHLVRFPKQFAQRSHLSIDGSVAIAASTKRTNHPVQQFLGEDAKLRLKQYLVNLDDKGRNIPFVFSIFPQEISILSKKPVNETLFTDLGA